MNRKLTGIILILGAVLFIIAAFSPITIAVVTETDLTRRTQALAEGQIAWLLVNLLFGAGSLVATIGLGLFIFQLQTRLADRIFRILSYLSALSFALATMIWLYICFFRLSFPAEEVANNLIVNGFGFAAYTLLSQSAFILLGIALLQTDYPRWLSRSILLLASLSVLAYLIFKDMPPFAHYVLVLLTGTVTLRWKQKVGN
jgi:hypothetical protein